jgi:hypothetical protein
VEAPISEIGEASEKFAPSTAVVDPPTATAAASIPKTPRKYTLAWMVAAAAVLLLLLVGLRSWNIARTDPVGRFWSPVLDQKAPTVISLGGVIF